MRKLTRMLLAVALATMPSWAGAETLALRTDFVKKYKNRAMIDASIEVDEHLKSPHSISKGGDDGDIHLAGRSDTIGLPLVAEVVNARLVPDAGKLLNATPEGQSLEMTGFWRIWFEHLGKEPQIQGNPVPKPADSNPAHLFEIHPITKLGDLDLVEASLLAIPKYTAYPAQKAFGFYEGVEATIQASSTAIMIESGSGKYNYTEFYIEPAGSPKDDKNGGVFVLAQVFDSADSEEPLTSDKRRMVFAKGSDAEKQLAVLGDGERLHVLGIPRVNLSEVAAIAAKHGKDPVSVNLPYEMIVVGILEAEDSTSEEAPPSQ